MFLVWYGSTWVASMSVFADKVRAALGFTMGVSDRYESKWTDISTGFDVSD